MTTLAATLAYNVTADIATATASPACARSR